MAKLTKINHIGIAVNNIDESLPFWVDGLGFKLHHVEEVPGQKSKVAFLPVGESDVELVAPTAEEFHHGKIPGRQRSGHASPVLGNG